MENTNKTIQLVMLSLSAKLMKFQDEFELEINSNKTLAKKEKKIFKILGKMIDVESKMNKFQQIITENTPENKIENNG